MFSCVLKPYSYICFVERILMNFSISEEVVFSSCVLNWLQVFAQNLYSFIGSLLYFHLCNWPGTFCDFCFYRSYCDLL